MGATTKLERAVRRLQAQSRIPALSVALHRADRPLWTFTVGTSGRDGEPLEAGTRFAIGSVTKTFTAVLVLRARDDGLLDLDDPIGKHLNLPAHEELTVRRLLSHTAGLQREPHGDVWDTLDAPDVPGLLAGLERAERVLPPARRFHYSNLGFALLGHLAAKAYRSTWEEALAERILAPLGLTATTVGPADRAAVGYLVDAYSDHARPEPVIDLRAVAPAAAMWSTAADLARWAAFLADPAAVDPAGAVLRPQTAEEMRWPLTVTDETAWSVGVGLGLRLAPQGRVGDRVVHVGHTGAMPGFLAAAFGRPRHAGWGGFRHAAASAGGADTPGAMGCAVLASSGTADGVEELAHELLNTAVEADPADIQPWTPGDQVPAVYRSVLGRWWGEGFEYVFSWRDGALQARGAQAPAGSAPAVFQPFPDDPDVLRGVSGREVGELLRLTRNPDGTVFRMHWATYRFTRAQETFDGDSASGAAGG
jgi:CubicO group peptidase (beta-lactamase class C family)